MLLRRKVSLHDIEDVEAFVIMCIKRSGAKVDPRDYEELKAEGICLLLQMERKYIPQMDGYASAGRFSGYAVKYMPRKINEAWHRMQEHHTHRTMTDGKRRWVEQLPAESWDKMLQLSQDDQNGGLDETRIRLVHEFIDIPFTTG